MYRHKLNEKEAALILTWWYWLDENRGDRAKLRRASSPEDIVLTPAFFNFIQKMDWKEQDKFPITDLAMVASVMARVKKLAKDNASFAASLAKPRTKGGSKEAMSELRFQQLQKSRTEDEFFTRICRAVALLDGTVNVVSLADNILHWLAEKRDSPASKPEKRIAFCWASDYYKAL